MILLLAVLLFSQHPDPMEMPRAEAYFVTEHYSRRLEDRYNRFDLWQSHVVDGCWYDDDGRYTVTATLREIPPATDIDSVLTRVEYAAGAVEPDEDNDRQLLAALDRLTGEELSPDFEKIRQLPRGAKAVRFYSSTNALEIICAYLPEKRSQWRALIVNLIAGDDREESVKRMVTELLEPKLRELGPEPRQSGRRRKSSERELLRADARHSVSAFPEWRVTDSEEFTILDNLKTPDAFIEQVSNELRIARARFAVVMPSLLDASNTLAVARIFDTRAEFAEVCGEDMQWSAAYWNPQRRELVAYLPPSGGAELIRTLRHESFHQYLSYAVSMHTVSPWLNEGYAQYFEDSEPRKVVLPGDVKFHAANILPLLTMDYESFYGGSSEERHYKYQLARSLAYFIEVGAPNVFKQPFKNLKRDYLDALLRTHDPVKATSEAFGSKSALELFVSEWTKFHQ